MPSICFFRLFIANSSLHATTLCCFFTNPHTTERHADGGYPTPLTRNNNLNLNVSVRHSLQKTQRRRFQSFDYLPSEV